VREKILIFVQFTTFSLIGARFGHNDQAHLPAVQLLINFIDGYQLESTPKFGDELRVK
jgi:uncharacterized ion transporter superfamily protein YfcC